MDSLVAESERWRAMADALLAESQLLPFLREWGEVYFTGSYRYGLLLSADIDLYLLHPQAGQEQAVSILNALIEQGYWNVYFYGDWVNFRASDMPLGHYIGLKRNFGGVRWKVDIWNTPQVKSTYLEYNEWLERTLTPATRELILAIKQANIRYKWDLPGVTIYDAVLTNQVASLEAFRQQFVNVEPGNVGYRNSD